MSANAEELKKFKYSNYERVSKFYLLRERQGKDVFIDLWRFYMKLKDYLNLNEKIRDYYAKKGYFLSFFLYIKAHFNLNKNKGRCMCYL